MPAGPIGQPSIIPSPCLKLNAPSPFQQCSNNSAITILSLPCGTVNNYLPPPVVHIVYIKETSWLCISRKSLLILVSLVFKDEQTKQASSFCFIIQRSQRCTIHPERRATSPWNRKRYPHYIYQLWIPSSLQATAYKTSSVCWWQHLSSKTFLTPSSVTVSPKRPKRNQGEWIERETRDTMPTCPRSLLFLLPTPLWHRFISSFFFSLFFLLAETVWLLRLLSHGQMARTGDSPAQTKNKTEPQPPPDLLCANTFLCFAFFPSFKIFFFYS